MYMLFRIPQQKTFYVDIKQHKQNTQFSPNDFFNFICARI